MTQTQRTKRNERALSRAVAAERRNGGLRYLRLYTSTVDIEPLVPAVLVSVIVMPSADTS
jgi:hypothetical protein